MYRYGAKSFIKVTVAKEDRIGNQSQPSTCNTAKYVMYCKSRARQWFTVIAYRLVHCTDFISHFHTSTHLLYNAANH